MKIKTILISLMTISIVSCKKYLDIVPKTQVTENIFFKSASDFEQAVNGIYAPLQGIYESHWNLGSQHSDNTFFAYDVGQRGGQQREDFATFNVQSNNTYLSDNWSENFLIISRANSVLNKINEVSFDETEKNNLKGQAYFLRALAYYDLVRNFGDVPLFTAPVSSYTGAFKDRSKVDDVYKQIISDADSAAQLLPPKSSQSPGRATIGAAGTLLGSVYVTLGQWANAQSALMPVLSMGYHLLPNYSDVFNPTNKYNDEMIFEVGYTTGTSQTLYSTFPYIFLPRVTDPGIFTGIHPEAPNTYGFFNMPTRDLIEAFEDTTRDTRYRASIAFYTGPSTMSGVPYVNHFPYVEKYQYSHTVPGQTSQDWPIFRYSEVLLMLSECLNEQGNGNAALPYLNEVRNRAGISSVSTIDQTTLRAIIMNERRIEFAFEGKRWYDLVRTGKAVATMNSFGAEVKTNPMAYYYPQGVAPTASAFTLTENNLIYPIPLEEILINPSLKQNPGY